ncbi:hypothetical protein GGR28_003009 [Lewinella aquimaris]|uniref:Lipocalin-like domain-containing protein n=1 Tax=Neolewinella aquimaris TaxID=1835722 RepID=A0A840E9Z6_9BACT|nr:hypothetical protein [Neolewinella aquimaris]MBB4080375.1 hypothetical protein [Neolewinella aquimaris]
MSKYLLFPLIVGTLLFSGCGKEEEEGEYVITEADMVGTWNVDVFESTYNVSGIFLGSDVDDDGTSSISNSALRVQLLEDGSWISSGDYSLTVTTESESETTEQVGIGEGNWSFRRDTLFLDGMINHGGNGRFETPQECTITSFTKDRELGLKTRIDQTDSNADYGITLRTRADWNILLVR